MKPAPPKVTVTFIELCLSEKLYLETRPWWPKQGAKPFPGEPFDSKLTNGSKSDVLGDKGCVRIEPIPGGLCEVRFSKFYDEVDKLLGLPVPFPLPVPVPVPPVPPVPPKPTDKKQKLILVDVDPLFAPGVETRR